MWKRHFDNPWILASLAGISIVLSFPNFSLWPLSVLFPVFFLRLARCFGSARSAFLWGLFVSFTLMVGGGYWVVYVLHVFGYLPWSVAALLFLGFCSFAALNFPLFAVAVYWIDRWASSKNMSDGVKLVCVFPAVFCVAEYFVPKLFPWYLGHCLFKTVWLNQIAEITGALFLSFLLVCWGGAIYGVVFGSAAGSIGRRWLIVPAALTLAAALFSALRLAEGPARDRVLKVAIIQANIGSLEKAAARRGLGEKLRAINDLYFKMTDEAVLQKPDLIVWPETALAYRLNSGSELANQVENRVRQWHVPLITGAYSSGSQSGGNDFNAAFLVEPSSVFGVRYDHYDKNVLLAFGEYMPFGKWFPSLYRAFPQVSNFERGSTQKAFELSNGTRLGISICYEMILPEFIRKVVAQKVHLLVNLTNDSWFGPTNEPYFHGAMSVFRAIEHRTPIVRATNTGTSFVVDTLGRVGTFTKVYEPQVLIEEVGLPLTPPSTVYGRWGEWFVVVCLLGLIVFMIILRSSYFSLHLARQIWSRFAGFFVNKIGGVPNAVRRDFVDEKARKDAQR